MIEVKDLEAISKIILVVEDNAVIRMLLVEVLREENFAIMEANNAANALSILNIHGMSISLMLTDVHMPGNMNGLMLTHHVYLHWPSICLLIVSGVARPLLKDMPIGSRFLTKPYDTDQLIRNIRQMTSSS